MTKLNQNWSVIGHEAIIGMLSNAASNNKLAHAYLFLGPSHIGKRTIATRFVQSLQCMSLKGKPCLTCPACEQIEHGIHPDTQIIESNTKIKIEKIRELEHNLMLNSYNSPYKAVIIIDAFKMTPEAQNAFLKTLEEPSGRTIIILMSISKDKILPTIISRCQTITLRNVPTKKIEAGLAKMDLPAKKVHELAHLSFGKPGLAIRIINEPDLLDDRNNQIEKILKIIDDNQLERFSEAALISTNSISEVKIFLEYLLSWFRDLLMIKIKSEDSVNNLDYKEKLKKEASYYQKDFLENFIHKIEKAQEELSYNINLKLLLESLFLLIPEKKLKSTTV